MNRLRPEERCAVEQADSLCRSIVRARGKNFYVASRLLPAEARRGLFAVYAFARHVDDLVDEAPACAPPATIYAALERAESHLRSTCAGQPPPGFWPALGQAVARHHLSSIYFHDLIAGMRQDVVHRDFEDFATLSQYFYRVAGTIGFLVAQVLGHDVAAADRHIRSLGAAFQLTNVLRDVGEDYRRGRIYLPADERERFGVLRSDLGRPTAPANLRRLVAFQAERARRLFEVGESYVPQQGTGVVAVHVACGIYRAHLRELERQGYDPLSRRPSLSPQARLWAAVSTWLLRPRGPHRAARSAGRVRPDGPIL